MKQILLFFFCLITLQTIAQTQISGLIVDEKGEGLFGVNVSTDRLEGTVTDFDGKFVLNVKAGAFVLKLSSIGYVAQNHKISITESQKLVLNYTLKEEQVDVDDVVVYGSKRGKRIQEEVQSVEVVKAEILENNNVTDGLGAVNLLTGVTVLDGQMSVRGGSGYAYGVGSRVTLVQDGVPTLTPERDEINWDFIATENIEQMELLKGGGAVQYGSSALNGILSVRSAWARKKQETEVTLYNTFVGQPKVKGANWWKDEPNYFTLPHTLGATFTHRRKMKKNVDLSFSGMGHSFQSHLKDEFNERIRFNFNFRHRPSKMQGFTYGMYSMYMYRNDSFFFMWRGNEEEKYLPLAVYGKRYHYTTFHPFAKYIDKKGNSFKYNGSVYYDKQVQAINQSVKVFNDFQYQRKFKFKLDLVLGATVENYFVKAPALRDIYFESDVDGWFSGNKYAAYVLADYKIKGFSISGGARYELINLDKTLLSSKPTFNLGVNYAIDKKNYLRISFAQAFRIPSIVERYADESLGPVNVYPNPEIRPETGYTSELGYKRMLNIGKWKGSADIAFYWTEFDNMIEFNFGDYTAEGDSVRRLGFKALNVARARIFGWEINVEERGKIGPVELAIKLGYTYAYGVDLNANKRNENIGTFLGNAFSGVATTKKQHAAFEANPNSYQPRNPLYGLLRYRFRHTLKLDLNLKYKRFGLGANMAYYSYMDNVDEVFKVFINGIAEDRAALNYTGSFVLDLRAMYDIKDKVIFSFIVKNIGNNDYAVRPAKPNAPRTFTFQAKYKF